MSVGPHYASDSVFEQELRKRLGERLAEAQGHAVNGIPQDYAKYREMVGEIRGMQRAMAICDDIRKALNPERE